MAMTVSTVPASSARLLSAWRMRRTPSKGERLGDDGDGESVEFFGERRHDRRSAGARAAAKTRGDEDHVRALQQLDDALGVFESRLTADRRV